MKLTKKNYGSYAIILVLIFYLFQIFRSISFYPKFPFIISKYFSGDPTSIVSASISTFIMIILIVVSLVSFFINYKYNWVVISIPFLIQLLINYSIGGIAVSMGYIIRIIKSIYELNFLNLFSNLIATILFLIILGYLILKNVKKIESIKFEIFTGILIIILLSLNFLL